MVRSVRILTSFVLGLLFAVGLGLGGMLDPLKVIGFLDLAGAWDPSLAFVMGGAVAVHALSRKFILKRERPLFGGAFPTCATGRPDKPLVVGSVMFGAGWGIAGYCPGPALTSLGTGDSQALTLGLSLVAGMGLHKLWELARARGPAAVPAVVPVTERAEES